MEIKKPNDIFVATINNPNATTYDLMTLNLNPDNTELLNKDDYKESKYVKDMFTAEDGKFDDLAFNNAYSLAAAHFLEMTDDKYIKSLSEVQYSPFDITRPKKAKTFNVNVEFSKDYNPFKDKYSRSGINSIDQSNLSLREIAQQSKVYDPENKVWSEKSANDLSFIEKFFGDTLVYAQWEEDGTHIDPETGRNITHKKGDWKVNEDGNLYLEKLSGREIYGKQIVNPMDLLTTDGSVANNFDFFDADGREKSILKTTVRLTTELAPLLIPNFNKYYAGVRAALSLASVMPTFYKSFEGILLGDTQSSATKLATAAEGYISKYSAQSYSDEAQGSFFNYEQMSQMVADIFGQIYEQRAMASLSKYVMKNPVNISETEKKYMTEIQRNALESVKSGKITSMEAFRDIQQAAIEKIPSLKAFQKSQSQLAKSLSLGYMALTSTADIYGQAIQGGYDRRTAGFASLMAATGQYGLMMNNRMGDWFLDKTTGYSQEVNRALVRKAAIDYLEPIKKAFASKTKAETKFELAKVFKNFKGKLFDTFTSPSELGEAMFKNSFIEGVEEVTEQVALDATKGIIDVLSYFNLTEKKGSFGGMDVVFSKEGLQNYLANFVGGLLGGAMFEFNTSEIEPFLSGQKINKDVKRDIYKLIANDQTDALIEEINKQRYKLGNSYIAPSSNQEEDPQASDNGISEADVIADTAIGMIKRVDGLLNQFNLKNSDEDIIKKAMLDYLIIQDINATKDDRGYGIDGLILDDYYSSVEQIADIQSKIKNLSLTDTDKQNNKEQIDNLRELSKIYESKVKDILEGKNAEKYYNEMLFYLSKPISEAWLSIDKDTYTRTKYNTEFDNLPLSGLGLSQESVEKEWKEYLDSSDLRKHIEIATNAYLNLEKELNPSLEQYMSSGYDIQRAQTYKLRLDLDNTINLFNTSNPEEKEQILNRIRFISDKLKENSKSSMNILPWDVLHQDLGKKLIELGMVGTANLENGQMHTDEKGNIIATPFTKDNLASIVSEESGLTLNDVLEKQISLLFSDIPINPLNIDASIKIINAMIVSRNNSIDNELSKLISKPELSEEDKQNIKLLEADRLNFVLLPYTNSSTVYDIINQKKIEVDNLYVELDSTSGLNKNIIEKYKSDDYFDPNTNKNDAKNLEWLININKSDITPEFVDSLSDEMINSFENSNLNKKLDQGKDLYNKLLEAKDQIDVGKTINENKETILNFISKENKLLNSINEEIEENTPNILKMRNYALDLLLKDMSGDSENSPNLDAEMIDHAEKMVNDITDNFRKTYFSKFDKNSVEDIIYIINNAKILANKINNSKKLNSEAVIDEETNEVEINWINTYDAFKSEFGDDPIMNFVSDSEELNNTLRQRIIFLSNIKDFQGLDQVNLFLKLKSTVSNKIENPLYKLLKNFELSLREKRNINAPSVFDILEREDKALLAASDINNYLTEGVKLNDISNAINIIKLFKSAVYAMSTTTVGFDDPYGFIASRQNFLKKHKIESESINLKTISSDIAELGIKDLTRIQVKLQFYLDLARSNAGKIISEQATIGTKMQEIFYNKLKELISLDIFKNIRPKFEEIDKNSSKSSERKLMELESLIYEEFKNKNKFEVLDLLLSNANILVDPRKLSKIDKDVTKDKINDYDFAIYLSTILSVNSRDFDSRMHSLLESFDKAPFFSQELAMKVAYASLVNPDLFSKIIEFDHEDESYNTADLITFVLGNGGTGKTTVVFKMLLKYLQQTNSSISLWFVAPEIDQATKLHDDVLKGIQNIQESETLSKFGFYEKLGIKDIMADIVNDLRLGKDESEYFTWTTDANPKLTLKEDTLKKILETVFKDTSGNINENLPNLIFIDEVTHFSSLELEILNTIMKSLPKEKRIKIVAAGDISQNGFRYGINSDDVNNIIELNVDRVKGVYTPKLTVSVRSSNILQRENLDLTITLSEKLSEIYQDLDIGTQESRTNALLDIYKSQKLFNLKYYKGKDIIHGTLIDQKLSDQVIEIIKSNLESVGNENKTIGILTETGDYQEYVDALNKLGLLNKDGSIDPKVKIFSLDKVQGNEVDFFIFNSKIIRSPKPHHRLRDFYTYISRAKDATIVIDENNSLSNQFNIINSQEMVTDIRNPLTNSVIEESRNNRISVLEGLLDNNYKINDDNFKFGEGVVFIDNIENTITSEDDLLKNPINLSPLPETKGDDYQYMFHTFYNNPNVKLTPVIEDNKQVDVKIDEIIFSEENSPTDLNIRGINNFDKDKIIDGWLNIKNYYTYNKSLPDDTNSLQFYYSLFGNSVIPSNIKSSIVITASRFNSETNSPIYKKGFDVKQIINDGTPFINLSLKLEYNGEIHYITLATISSNTVETWFGKESMSNKMYTDIINKLDVELPNNYKTLIEISNIDSSLYKQITSIRFLSKDKNSKPIQTYVDNINSFRGLKKSAIMLFPTDKQSFVNIVNKYSFGEKRKDEDTPLLNKSKQVMKDDKGDTINIPGLDTLFKKYKGKPYIVVSFNSEDLKGSESKDVQAKIVPLMTKSRPVSEVRSELKQLRKIYFEEENKDEREKIKHLFKNIVSTTQIIDILIGISKNNPSLFNSMINPISNLFKNTPLSYLKVVTGDKNNSALSEIINIFEKIKSLKDKSIEDTKTELQVILSTNNFWKNYISNIMILDDLVNSEKNKLIKDNNEQGKNIDKELEMFDNLIEISSNFIKAIENESPNIYWNLAKGKDGKVLKYSFTNNELNKYQPESFLYFNGIPESPRFLINLKPIFEKYLNKSNIIDNSTKESKQEIIQENVEPKRTEISAEESITDNIKSNNLDFQKVLTALAPYNKDGSYPDELKWRYDLASALSKLPTTNNSINILIKTATGKQEILIPINQIAEKIFNVNSPSDSKEFITVINELYELIDKRPPLSSIKMKITSVMNSLLYSMDTSSPEQKQNKKIIINQIVSFADTFNCK